MSYKNRKLDSQIHQEVVAALGRDFYVSACDVGVQVKNAVVTLAGREAADHLRIEPET